MNRRTPYLVVLLVTTVVAGTTAASAGTPASVANAVPDSLQRALTLALLDEYDARDAYQAAVDRFGPVQPFGNVLAAEEHHISALLRHFRKLRLAIPQTDKKLRPAPTSVNDACRAAVKAERASVALYTRLLPTVAGHPEITETFRNLLAASRDRHLPAFERCVERTTTESP
jgi:hypothetical protein